MRKILTALVALVSLLSTVPIVMPATITASVIVPSGICDIAVSPNLNFDSMVPGATSASDVSTVVSMPTGNQESAPVSISGAAWTGGTGMAVSQTHWSLTSLQAYGSMSELGTGLASAGTFGPTSPETVYFKLSIPAGQAAATYTQTITFTGCQ